MLSAGFALAMLLVAMLRVVEVRELEIGLPSGLATPLWFYSLTFWEHTPALALLTWAAVFRRIEEVWESALS